MSTGFTAKLHEVVEVIGLTIDAAGVLVIVAGLVLATFRFAAAQAKDQNRYHQYRLDLGRGILLGLEFLVAGDIIRTVAVDPNLENVAVLAVIVAVRTFLSLSLQVELEGRWPWQQKPDGSV